MKKLFLSGAMFAALMAFAPLAQAQLSQEVKNVEQKYLEDKADRKEEKAEKKAEKAVEKAQEGNMEEAEKKAEKAVKKDAQSKAAEKAADAIDDGAKTLEKVENAMNK